MMVVPRIGLSQWEATALNRLTYHWGSCYDIRCSDGTWSASHVDSPAAVMTADEPEELLEQIHGDYSRRLDRKRLTIVR